MLFWSENAGVFNGEKNGGVGEFEPPIPENTNTLVVGDAMNPRFDRALSTERRQSGLHRYECRLDNVLSLVKIGKNASSQGENGIRMEIEKVCCRFGRVSNRFCRCAAAQAEGLEV